jgi:hypothetical protein
MREGSFEVGQLAEGASDPWQITFGYLCDWRWFGVEHLCAWIAAGCLRERCLTSGCEVLYDRWVERLPRAVSQGVDDIARPQAEQLRRLRRHTGNAGWSSDLLPTQRTSSAAVPPFVNLVQAATDTVRKPDAT